MHEESMTGSEASRKDMLPGAKRKVSNGKGRYVVSAGPGEFAGKVIGHQDLAALLAAR